jgi:hypothetical protein
VARLQIGPCPRCIDPSMATTGCRIFRVSASNSTVVVKPWVPMCSNAYSVLHQAYNQAFVLFVRLLQPHHCHMPRRSSHIAHTSATASSICDRPSFTLRYLLVSCSTRPTEYSLLPDPYTVSRRLREPPPCNWSSQSLRQCAETFARATLCSLSTMRDISRF